MQERHELCRHPPQRLVPVRVDGVDRPCGIRRIGHGAHEELPQRILTPEQNLTLVGEVPEERSLRFNLDSGHIRA